MKRNLLIFVGLFGAVTLLTAQSSMADPGLDTRRVVKEYSGPGVVDWNWPTGGGGGSAQLNGIKVVPRAGESQLRASIVDSVHPEMGAYIRQSKSDTHPRVFHGFCESTSDVVKIDPSRPVWIYVSTTPCGQVPGTPVNGEVTLTFIGT